MAKALVIKGADFSTNKVTTVEFADRPCTGITLDSQTLSFSDFEKTSTLTATVTPTGCTDAVVWTSSDADVASVSGGVVTSHRPGTATITVTCGEYSASCAVTVALDLVAAKNIAANLNLTDNNTTLVDTITGSAMTNNRYIYVGSAQRQGVYPVTAYYNEGDFADCYPIPIPVGAKTINVKNTNLASIITYFNGDQKSTASLSGRVRDSAKVLDGETSSSGTNWSISGWTYDERTYTIPNNADIDSFSLQLYTTNSTAFTNFDVDTDLEITFGFE